MVNALDIAQLPVRLADSASMRAGQVAGVVEDHGDAAGRAMLEGAVASASDMLMGSGPDDRPAGLLDVAAWALVALAWPRGAPVPQADDVRDAALRDALGIPSWRYGGPGRPAEMDEHALGLVAQAADERLDLHDAHDGARALVLACTSAFVALVGLDSYTADVSAEAADAALARFVRAREERDAHLLASARAMEVEQALGSSAALQARRLLRTVLWAWRAVAEAAVDGLDAFTAARVGAQADELGGMALALVDQWRLEETDALVDATAPLPLLADAIAQRLAWMGLWAAADPLVCDVGEMWFGAGEALLNACDELDDPDRRGDEHLGLPGESIAYALVALGVLSAVCDDASRPAAH